MNAAASSDEFGRIEVRGGEAVPAAERHGRPRELGFLWAGAFVNYTSLLTASLLTTYMHLGVWDGFAAVAIGSLAGAVILGLLCNTGPASGLPQVAWTRSVFGGAGAKVAAALTLFLALGWFAVDCVIAGQAAGQLGLGGSQILWTAVVAVVSVVVAVYGHGTIKVLEKFGAIVFGLLTLALFAALAPQMHFDLGASVTGADHNAAFILGAMTCFALVASWYPFASDYSRYLPENSSRRAVTLWPVVGVGLPMLLLGIFGLLVPTIDAQAAQNGVLAVIAAHATRWVTLPFFAFVILGEIWANYLDVYTAGLVSLELGIRLRRWQTALACGVLGFALAAYAILVTDFHVAYEDFLILTYLWAPAWAAVVLLAFFSRERLVGSVSDGAGTGRPLHLHVRAALVAWGAGTLVSLAFVNYPNLFGSAFPSAHFPNQGLIDGMHGADLSGIVSAAMAAAVYWLATRRRAGAQPV